MQEALDKQELTRVAAERDSLVPAPVHRVPAGTQFLVLVRSLPEPFLVLVLALMLNGALVQGGYW